MNELIRLDPTATAHAGKLGAASLPMPDVSGLIEPDQLRLAGCDMKPRFSILLRPMNRDMTTPLMTLDVEADTVVDAVNSAMNSYALHNRHTGIGALMIKVFPLSFPLEV